MLKELILAARSIVAINGLECEGSRPPHIERHRGELSINCEQDKDILLRIADRFGRQWPAKPEIRVLAESLRDLLLQLELCPITDLQINKTSL